jgi:hypothetical protein
MVIFHSFLYVYQRVTMENDHPVAKLPWHPVENSSRPEGFQGGTKEAFRDLLALQALKVFVGS